MKTLLVCFMAFMLLTGCQTALESIRADLEEAWPFKRQEVIERVEPEFKFRTISLGSPVFIRIFKNPAILELWIQEDGSERYALYKKFPICKYSGDLGPKLYEGDKQSPEGFYQVSSQSMNPNSQYYLSFNIGFPNKYDQSLGRTGSLIMVHGGCESIGCYAMTDAVIEEIYTIVDLAHSNGQQAVPVHIFPFPMTKTNIMAQGTTPWRPFWQNLKTGYDYFEMTKRPPEVFFENGRYLFGANSKILND